MLLALVVSLIVIGVVALVGVLGSLIDKSDDKGSEPAAPKPERNGT